MTVTAMDRNTVLQLINRPLGLGDFVPKRSQQAADHRFAKQTLGAFTGTDLKRHRESFKLIRVAIADSATCSAVDSTARQAPAPGFVVIPANGAMTAVSANAHGDGVSRLFPSMGEKAIPDDKGQRADNGR